MTAAPLPNLLASFMAVPAAPGAGTAAASETVDAGALAAEFAGLLAEFLPGTLDASGETGKAESEGAPREAEEEEQKQQDAAASDGQDQAAAMLGWGVAAPAVPLPEPAPSSQPDMVEDTAAVSAPASAVDVLPPEQTAEDLETAAPVKEAPARQENGSAVEAVEAAVALPAGFTIETAAPTVQAGETGASALPGNTAPAPSTSAAEVPGPASKALPENAELAFAARVSPVATADAPRSQRAPEMYLAMPHDVRTAAAAPAAGPAGVNEAAAVEPAVAVVPAGAAPAETAAGTAAAPPAAAPAPLTEPATAPQAAPETGTRKEAPAAASAPAGEKTVAAPAASAKVTAAAASGQAENAPEQRQKSELPSENGGAAPAHAGLRAPAIPGSPAPAAAGRAPAAGVPVPESEATVPVGESRAKPLHEFSVVVPGRSSEGVTTPQVEVKVIERTGEVQVAVRSADTHLTDSLRDDLGQLVSQLSERGYRAETWHPGASSIAAETATARTANASNDAAPDGDSRNPGRGGSDTAGRDGNARRDQRQNQPEWMDALERSLGGAQAPARSLL